MLVRLLIYVILGTVLYRAARSWFGRPGNGADSGKMTAAGQVDDVMIKDPMCGTYFPQGKAVALDGKDQAPFFCSTECRDRYRAERS